MTWPKKSAQKNLFTLWRENKKANDYQGYQSMNSKFISCTIDEKEFANGLNTMATKPWPPITGNDGQIVNVDQNDYDDLCDQLMDVRHVFKRSKQ